MFVIHCVCPPQLHRLELVIVFSFHCAVLCRVTRHRPRRCGIDHLRLCCGTQPQKFRLRQGIHQVELFTRWSCSPGGVNSWKKNTPIVPPCGDLHPVEEHLDLRLPGCRTQTRTSTCPGIDPVRDTNPLDPPKSTPNAPIQGGHRIDQMPQDVELKRPT